MIVSAIALVVAFTCSFFFDPSNVLANGRPNIVMILVDDLAYGELREEVMPNCWQLAQRGSQMRLYSHQTCSATRAALLTGLYPQQVNMQVSWPPPLNNGLPVNQKIISEHLFEAGYKCGAFGKWHMGWKDRSQWPTRRGFDEFAGFLGGQISSYGSQESGIPYPDGSIGHDHHGMHDLQFNEVPLYTDKYSTHLFRDFSKLFIKENANQDAPFFLYVPFNAPHGPYAAPREYVKRALNTGEFQNDLLDSLETYADDVMAPPTGDVLLNHATAPLMYRAMVYALDDAVGEIYEQLEASGVADNTLFVFASDNGSGFTRHPSFPQEHVYAGSLGPLRAGKGSSHEGGVRVANFIVWPDKISPQQKIDSNVWIGDLTTTFLEIGEVNATENFDGTSIMPAITDNEELRRKNGAERILVVGWRREAVASAAIVFRDRKYIRTVRLNSDHDEVVSVVEQVYDLGRDIGEDQNVVDDPRYAHWVTTARAQFDRYGGDQMLIGLDSSRPPGSVWAGFDFTEDYGFPNGTPILETQIP